MEATRLRPAYWVPDEKNHELFQAIAKIVYNSCCSIVERPVLLGITGAGGAGKSTFARNMVDFYGADKVAAIDLDDYLVSRDERNSMGLLGYDPEANRLDLARKHLAEIRRFRSVVKPRYDHSNGTNPPDELFTPKKLVVVEGVTTLYPEIAHMYDVSVFFDADEETQKQSRVMRDHGERGYTLEEALKLHEDLKPLYAKYIEPTMQRASLVGRVTPDYVFHITGIQPKLEEMMQYAGTFA